MATVLSTEESTFMETVLSTEESQKKAVQTGNRKKYPRLAPDVKDKFGHVYYGPPIGLREKAVDNECSPEDANLDDLLPGEVPVGQYDVYFPGKVMPMWLFIIIVICTFGMYYVYYHIKIYCWSRGSCLPKNLEFTRGRIMVTSHGRILVWSSDYAQTASGRTGFMCLFGLDLLCRRLCFGPEPVTSEGFTATGQHMLRDVSEIVLDTERVPSYLCGMGSCAGSFSGSIKIYFKTFDTMNTTASTLACSSISAYEAMASGRFGGGGSFASKVSNPATHFLEITSIKANESDYDIENATSAKSFASLGAIYTSLNELLIKSRSASPWALPSGPGASKLEGADVVDAKWGTMSIVDEMHVQLPADFAPLGPGEAVLASQANMYMMSKMDWVKSALTCGLYFFFVLGDKRKIRPGLVLTTHRVIEITPALDDALTAFCPKVLADLCFPVKRGLVVRSLYPREVYSGVLARNGFTLECTLCTDAGAVGVVFDKIPVGLAVDEIFAPNKFSRKLNFCHALMSAATRRSLFEPASGEALAPTFDEKTIFPFAAGEVPLARYAGDIARDMCAPLCTKKRSWYPGACVVASCGVKPVFFSGSLTLTSTSFYVFQSFANKPFACWACLTPFVKEFNWQLLWTPLDHLMDTTVATAVSGKDSCSTRCCKDTFIGLNCCPFVKSVLTVSVKAKTNPAADGVLTAEVGNLSMLKSLRADPAVKAFRNQVARVQSHLVATPEQQAQIGMPVNLGKEAAPTAKTIGTRV